MKTTEKIREALRQKVLDGWQRMTVADFFQLARQLGIVRSQSIREYLQTFVAQGFFEGPPDAAGVLTLNAEMLAPAAKEGGDAHA